MSFNYYFICTKCEKVGNDSFGTKGNHIYFNFNIISFMKFWIKHTESCGSSFIHIIHDDDDRSFEFEPENDADLCFSHDEDWMNSKDWENGVECKKIRLENEYKTPTPMWKQIQNDYQKKIKRK